MFNAEQLQEKWAPLLDYNGLGEIKDSHRRAVTAILLENQEKALREEREFLYETPTVNTDPGASGNAEALWCSSSRWSSCRFRPCSDLPNPSFNA